MVLGWSDQNESTITERCARFADNTVWRARVQLRVRVRHQYLLAVAVEFPVISRHGRDNFQRAAVGYA